MRNARILIMIVTLGFGGAGTTWLSPFRSRENEARRTFRRAISSVRQRSCT